MTCPVRSPLPSTELARWRNVPSNHEAHSDAALRPSAAATTETEATENLQTGDTTIHEWTFEVGRTICMHI